MDAKRLKKLQNQADVFTFICLFSFVLLAYLIANQPSGAAALYLIFPVIVVALMHLGLGIAAIACAISTGRFLRNLWVYLYFVGAVFIAMWYTGLLGGISESVKARLERYEFGNETQLYTAIEEHQVDQIERSINAGADLGYCFAWDKSFRDHSPLQLALKKNRPAVAASLLRAGADPNHGCANDRHSPLPIVVAAQNLDLTSLGLLIEQGANVNPPGEQFTALVMAMVGDNYSLPERDRVQPHLDRRNLEKVRQAVERLLDSGADSNARQQGDVPLHWAIAFGDEDLVQLLIAAGADPNIEDRLHRTPLTLSIFYGRSDITRRLLYDTPALTLTALSGFRALTTAVRYRDQDAIEMLLDAGVDLSSFEMPQDASGYVRAIHLPEQLSDALADDDNLMFDTLIRAGADVNQPNKNRQGQLLVGLFAHQPEKLARLLAAGADVNAKNSAGATALHYFAGCKRCSDPIPAMRALIAQGAHINAADARGETPLKIAIRNGLRDTEDLLTAAGALESLGIPDE